MILAFDIISSVYLIMNDMEGQKNNKKQLTHIEVLPHKSLNLKMKQRIIFSKPAQKTGEKTQQTYPAPRIHHSSIFYRNKIFVWGGSIEDSNSKLNLFALYIYEIETKRWKKFMNKTASQQKDAFLGQCHTVINNRWYLFGGVNRNDDYVSQLWKLNLDNYEWTKCDQKNEIPYPSEGGCLVGLQKNWLLHYQGFNSQTVANAHYIYIYSNDSKNWHCCEGNYQFILKSRIGTSMCQQNGKVFLFGGASYGGGQYLQHLNDFYELSIHTPTKYSKAKVSVRIISVNPNISPRSGHFLFPIQKNYICLLGGRNNEQTLSELWIYNIKTSEWIKDSSFYSPLLMRNGLSYSLGGDQLFLFGGMIESNDEYSYANDLWSIKIGWQELNNSEEDSENTEITFNNNCCLCYQKRNNFIILNKEFCSTMIKDLQEQIKFPFAAFGLLVDNCIMIGANEISIQFETDINQEYFIKIQDNGKNTWNDQQFIVNITHFCSQNNSILIGNDKKIRKSIIRSNQAREFGVNLKLGGLRLGKRILYISIQAGVMRVCTFNKFNIDDGSQKSKYVVNYYSYNLENNKLTDQQMKSSQQEIEQEYSKYIHEAIQNKNHKNILYIFETCINDDQEQLYFSVENNNLQYGNLSEIKQLRQMGYNTLQSIDISLRAYLSVLYLKNQAIQLSMGAKNKLQLIHIQQSLDYVDKLCKSGVSIELDGIIEFDFKFAEFYYLRELKQSMHFFSNGVLLYYKNRLITRYKVQLGETIDFLLSKHSGFYNYLPFFGFAQLPQNIPLNASKTAFAFTVMLEKMQSRFKFVDENFKARASGFLRISQLRNPRTKALYQELYAHKSKKSIAQASSEKQLQSKKRYPQMVSEQPAIKKRSKRKIQASLDFIPPSYQLRQIEKQLKKAKQLQEQSKPQQRILIQHIEQSQIQQNERQ